MRCSSSFCNHHFVHMTEQEILRGPGHMTPTNQESARGRVFEFRIPVDVLERWERVGLVDRLLDLDLKTGVLNDELRFAGSLAEQLMRYMVR